MGKVTEGSTNSEGRSNKSLNKSKYKRMYHQSRRGQGQGYGNRGRGRGRGGYNSGGGGGDNWNKRVLNEGMKGFLCTCNMNEKSCVKEAFNLLNEYLRDEDLGQVELKPTQGICGEGSSNTAAAVVDETVKVDPQVEKMDESKDIDDDIEAVLGAEIKELKNIFRSKFFNVETNVPNLVFIKSTVKDPALLAHRMLNDITTKKEQKARFLLRLLPVELTCKASMDQIEGIGRRIFPNYFAGDFSSFQILYKSRYNSKIDRSEVIKLLANLVSEINPLSVVDLTNPKYSIIVEVVKNIVCMSVVTDFNKFKKYNLHEAASDESEKKLIEGIKKPNTDNVAETEVVLAEEDTTPKTNVNNGDKIEVNSIEVQPNVENDGEVEIKSAEILAANDTNADGGDETKVKSTKEVLATSIETVEPTKVENAKTNDSLAATTQE